MLVIANDIVILHQAVCALSSVSVCLVVSLLENLFVNLKNTILECRCTKNYRLGL